MNLEDYLSKNSLFDLVLFDQFNGDILKYWQFIARSIHNELANIALRLFGICINSASLERLFSTMGFFHSKRRNKLGVSNIFYFI